MKSLFFSTATADTTRNSPHHCPSCRCYFSPQSHNKNVYTSPSVKPLNCDHMIMTFNPSQTLLAKTTPEYGKYCQPLNCNITFSYTSPIWLKKNHSSESRFNTKKFKESHFPHLRTKDDSDQPVLQILKNRGRQSNRAKCLKELEKTPEKPQILQMKKPKGFKKSSHNISNNTSKSLNLVSKSSSLNQQPSSDLNEEQIKPQEDTPIDYFKVRNDPNQFELGQNSKQQIRENYTKPKEYPTARSIDVYQPNQCSEMNQKGLNRSETSLKVQEKEEEKKWSSSESDRELASTLSEQLGLHFDYFVLNDNTDRSLSLNIDL